MDSFKWPAFTTKVHARIRASNETQRSSLTFKSEGEGVRKIMSECVEIAASAFALWSRLDGALKAVDDMKLLERLGAPTKGKDGEE